MTAGKSHRNVFFPPHYLAFLCIILLLLGSRGQYNAISIDKL